MERVIFLSGCGTGKWVDAALRGADGMLGMMMTPDSGRRLDLAAKYPYWAADNACYTKGDSFRLDVFLAWLEAMRSSQERCLFAVAPDVVGDAAATLERSLPVLPALRVLGYRAAFVGQDGLESLSVPWDAFDALFIGGSTEWKLSEHAVRSTAEAKQRGKWVHWGRVNSLRRLRLAQIAGADSVDGTLIAFGPDKRWKQLVGWLHEVKLQPVLSAS